MKKNTAIRADIAIIGMACVFPKAPDLDTFWQNIVSKVDAIDDPPADSLASRVYEPESDANDRIYCNRGGYLKTLPPFRYTDYGVMPVAIDGAEPEHFMALKVASDALADAGFPQKPFDRQRTEVILGRGTFVNRGYMTVMQHGIVIDQTLRLLKELHPEYSAADLAHLKDKLKANLPPFTPETAPGLCHNVMAGMIANRLDLKGRTMVLDAACASSMLALEIGMDDLLKGKCDAVVIGGVQISTDAPIHMIFTQLGALSRLAHLKPFDKYADGTMLGEGIGMMVLKRRKDAVRDGHRIYAVVKAVGSSSDGQGKGLLAPRVEGEALAVRRAYEAAGIDPGTIELVEAHGTAIPLGDATEIEALRRVFGARNGDLPRCAIGTVKSMIGHLIPAAGVAGMIKAALAVYHKILPPTLYCDQPNPDLEIEKTPFYINTHNRPWIHGISSYPRRAAVSSFGFGGINAHVILEEDSAAIPAGLTHHHQDWATELCVLQGATRADLIRECENLQRRVAASEPAGFIDIARDQNTALKDGGDRLAIVADSPDDLAKKLEHAIERLKDPKRVRIRDKSGIYFFEKPLGHEGKLAFVFPGEGSQYVNMLSDVCLHFPEARACFDLLDCAYADHPRNYRPSDFIFPATDEIRARAEARIWQMDSAVDAVTTANRALLKVMGLFGVVPDAVVGHSSGEMAALEAAGAVELDSEQEVIHHIRAGNGVIEALEAANDIPQGQLLAVGGVDPETVSEMISDSDDFLTLAMDNCPHQFVLCGTESSIARVTPELKKLGGICQPLPFKRAYHTRRFEPALAHLEKFFKGATFVKPRIPLYSCMTAGLYPSDPESILRYALEQWAQPVRFRETVKAMYTNGIRIFLELGPRGNLTAFVNDILKGKSVLAVSANVHHRAGLTQLNHALAMLAAHGVPLDLSALYRYRRAQKNHAAGHSDSDAQSAKGSVELSLALPMLNLENSDPHASLSKRPSRQAQRHQARGRSQQTAPAEGIISATAAADSVGSEFPVPDLQPPADGFTDAGPDAPSADIMQEYFNTMDRFLDMQQQVMAAYMEVPASAHSADSTVDGRRPAESPQPDPGSAQLPLSGRDQGPVPQDGCSQATDSAEPKHMTASHPNEAAATPTAEPVYDEKYVQNLLIACVSDKTGYPPDMLTPDQKLEADLGIDSIKRVEILGVISRQLDFLEQLQPDELKDLKTIGQIAGFLSTRLTGKAHADQEPAGTHSESSQAAKPTGAAPAPAAGLPFAGEIVRTVDGREITINRQLDLDHDLFLRQHTLGGSVSQYDQTLLALPVMPFSMSAEIMANAAALLFPGMFLVAMKNLKAHDWIILEDRQLALQIHAAVKPGTREVRVEIRITGDSDQHPSPPPVMEGTMVYADAYPPPPATEDLEPGPEAAKNIPPQDFYPSAMFHGPSFQSVRELLRCGEHGVEARLSTPPQNRLFAGNPDPGFLTMPVLLDAAGQAVGLWAAHFLENNYVVFPGELAEVRFYSAAFDKPADARCRAQTSLEGDTFIRSNIDLVGESDILMARIKGLQHKRINMPAVLHHFRGSRDVYLSSPWHVSLEPLDPEGRLVCCRINPADYKLNGAEARVLQAVIAQIVLGRHEREDWSQLPESEPQRSQWLLSRVAGKEAVRRLIKKADGLDIWPADIEIQIDDHGQAVIAGGWIDQLDWRPYLSLIDSQGLLLALAIFSRQGARAGTHLEALPSNAAGSHKPDITESEAEFLKGMNIPDNSEWAVRIGCARKAVYKAIGSDQLDNPADLEITQIDTASGLIDFKVSGLQSPDDLRSATQQIKAYTVRKEAFILATAIFEDGGSNE